MVRFNEEVQGIAQVNRRERTHTGQEEVCPASEPARLVE